MYIELDNYLLGHLPMDYWYDEGFSIARGKLSKFSQQDWEELSSNVLSKPLDYQRKLAYCIENSGNENELNILLLMINTDDEELFETCVDSLRGFIDIYSKHLISKKDALINHINGLMTKAGNPTRKVYEDFIRRLNTE